MQFIPVKTATQIATVSGLAYEIFPKHYDPIVPPEVTRTFLKTFQSESAIQKQLQEDQYEYFLLESEDDEIVGYVGVCPKDGALYISKFYLLANQRGKGYGQSTLDFLNQWCRNKGYTAMELVVNKLNEDSVRFYEKNGFKILGEIANPVSDKAEVIDFKMRLDLRQSYLDYVESLNIDLG